MKEEIIAISLKKVPVIKRQERSFSRDSDPDPVNKKSFRIQEPYEIKGYNHLKKTFVEKI